MAFYVTLYVVVFTLDGLWLWAVSRWTGLRFPVADILITVALCSAVSLRPPWGWVLGLIILGLIVTRVEDADVWPELAFMAGGTVLIWLVSFGAALALLG